jgi:hypothetical protein
MHSPFLIKTTDPTNLHFDTNFFVSENKQISSEINSAVEGFFAYVTEFKTPKKDIPVWYIDKHTSKATYSGGAEYGQVQNVIILTNDTYLIEGGIQELDIDFLKYFVENPSCEGAELHSVELCSNCGEQHCDNSHCKDYKDEKFYLISTPQNTVTTTTTYCEGHLISSETINPKEESDLELLPDFKLSKTIFDKIGGLKDSKDNTEISEIDKKAMDLLKDKWQHLYMFGYPQKPFPTNYERELSLVKLVLYESFKSETKQELTKQNIVSSEEREKYFKEKEERKNAHIQVMYEVHKNRKQLKKEIESTMKKMENEWNDSNNKLVAKSKEVKFISRDNLISVSRSYYFLWMCEFQDWFRTENTMDITPERFIDSSEQVKFRVRITGSKMENLGYITPFGNYNEALENGLLEACRILQRNDERKK